MGGGISQQEVVNEATDLVSSVIVNIALYCNTQAIGNQTIEIDCQPVLGDPNSVFENSTKCRKCMDDIVASQLAYYSTQRQAWTTRPAQVNKPIDSDYQNVINQFVVCTTQACKACNVQNVSQTNIIKSTLGCNAFNNVKNSLSQKLSAAISQSLTNNQDMLSPLAEMLGSSSYSDVVTNLTNRISALITDNVISNIQQTLVANQSMTFNAGTIIHGITQMSAQTVVQNYLSQNNILNDMFSDTEWKTLQTLANDQNTIDSVGNTVTKAVSYLSKCMTNIVGKVVLFILLLVAVLFVAIVVYILTNVIKKNLKKQHDKNVAEKTQAEQLPTFERF